MEIQNKSIIFVSRNNNNKNKINMNYNQKITSLAQELEATMNHSNEIMDEIIETVVEQAMVDALTDAFSKLSDEEQLAIALDMLEFIQTAHKHHLNSDDELEELLTSIDKAWSDEFEMLSGTHKRVVPEPEPTFNEVELPTDFLKYMKSLGVKF